MPLISYFHFSFTVSDIERSVAFYGDTLGLKLAAHRWINIGIRAADCNTQFAGQQRDPAHEGAADTEYMNVHVKPPGRGKELPPAAC